MEAKTDNELIADFMVVSHLHSRIRVETLKYNTSWDWLMPVVEKIEKLNFDVQVGSGCFCRIWDIDSGRMEEIETSYPTKLESVYKAVVEFIKWYNNEKVSNDTQ